MRTPPCALTTATSDLTGYFTALGGAMRPIVDVIGVGFLLSISNTASAFSLVTHEVTETVGALARFMGGLNGTEVLDQSLGRVVDVTKAIGPGTWQTLAEAADAANDAADKHTPTPVGNHTVNVKQIFQVTTNDPGRIVKLAAEQLKRTLTRGNENGPLGPFFRGNR